MKKTPPKNKSKGAAPENKATPPAPAPAEGEGAKSQLSVYLLDDDIAWLNAEAKANFRSGVSGQLSFIIAQARQHGHA